MKQHLVEDTSEIDLRFQSWLSRPEMIGCSLEEYRLLFSIARTRKPKLVLEIGPGHGASTLALFLGADSIKSLVQVRLHHLGTELVDEVFHPRITSHLETSREFFERCAGLFDLIFIDGDHSHEGASFDIENACDHLVDDGVILIHDTNQTDLSHIAVITKSIAEKFRKGYTQLCENGKGLGMIHPL